jgi:enoyl-CoA hydratase
VSAGGDSFRNLRCEVSDGLAVVTVDRPKVLNALDAQTVRELGDCIGALETRDDVAVIALTGAGEKAFIAGADIKVLAEQGVLEGKQNALLGQALSNRIERCEKPVIAAINGFALGGGLEIALCCDFRYATTNARLGLPEVSLGIIPGYGGTQRLPRLIGKGLALELILSGEMIDAEQALRIGLVNQVCEPAELLMAVRKVATAIRSRGPLAVRMAKQAVWRGLEVPIHEGLRIEADLFGLISATANMKEGMRAFLEKRKPGWQGR